METIRHDPVSVFPDLPKLTEGLAALLGSSRQAFAAATALSITPKPRPPLSWSKQDTVIIAPYSHLEPLATAPALRALANESRANAIIFSGGRTQPDWKEGDSEALRLHKRFNDLGAYDGAQHLEDRALYTRENFEQVAERFGEELVNRDRVILLMHDGQSGRGLMAARQAFCHTIPVMSEAAFAEKVVVSRYVSDIVSPAHDLSSPEALAANVAKMIAGARGRADGPLEGRRHLLPTPEEAAILQNLCTPAPEYASTRHYVRRYA